MFTLFTLLLDRFKLVFQDSDLREIFEKFLSKKTSNSGAPNAEAPEKPKNTPELIEVLSSTTPNAPSAEALKKPEIEVSPNASSAKASENPKKIPELVEIT